MDRSKGQRLQFASTSPPLSMFIPHPQANSRSSQLEGEAASLRSASQSAANRTAALEQENAALLAELAAAREAAATAQAAQAAAERNAQAAARKLESKAAAESRASQVGVLQACQVAVVCAAGLALYMRQLSCHLLQCPACIANTPFCRVALTRCAA